MIKSIPLWVLAVSLLCLSPFSVWSTESRHQNYVKMSLTQTDESGVAEDLYGGDIESKIIIMENVYLQGAYHSYGNSNEHLSSINLGIGKWVALTDKLTLTGYTHYKKTHFDINNPWEAYEVKIVEGVLGSEVDYQLSDSLSLIAQFDLVSTKLTGHANGSSLIDRFIGNYGYRRLGLGIKGKINKFNYEIINSSAFSNQETFKKRSTF